MKIPGRQFLAGFPLALVLALPLISPPPARGECLLEYADCVDAASELDSFWQRSAAGLRCYLDLVSCLQLRLA